MKTLYTTLIAAGLLLASGCACAATINTATFDFGEIAKGNEYGASSILFTDGGISVTATAYMATPSGGEGRAINPYLDHDRNGNAGLGACKILGRGAQCAPNSDDNVTAGEVLKLTFSEEVTIDSITFKNGSHGNSFTGNFKLGVDIDGNGWVPTALANMSGADITGTEFEFWNYNSEGRGAVDNEKQFYINDITVSAVPVPAAVWLFGSGLLGMVAVARRKPITA